MKSFSAPLYALVLEWNGRSSISGRTMRRTGSSGVLFGQFFHTLETHLKSVSTPIERNLDFEGEHIALPERNCESPLERVSGFGSEFG